MTRATLSGSALFAAALLAAGQPAQARQVQGQEGARPAVDPTATAALDKMGAYLRTLKAYQVKADTSQDEVLSNGQSAEFESTVDFLVEKPNRLRAEVTGDRAQRMYFFDGQQLSIWAKRQDYYASVPAPPTIAELVDHIADKYGMEMPLADLFKWGTDKAQTAAITSAKDLGPSQVEGVSCQHYAFRQEGLDWEIWIQKGQFPLPRKMVLTTREGDTQPRYRAVLDWNLAPSFNEQSFKFVPPPQAKKIVVEELGGSAGQR
jgi:hypothetical protein